jgi:hypothetical protein
MVRSFNGEAGRLISKAVAGLPALQYKVIPANLISLGVSEILIYKYGKFEYNNGGDSILYN